MYVIPGEAEFARRALTCVAAKLEAAGDVAMSERVDARAAGFAKTALGLYGAAQDIFAMRDALASADPPQAVLDAWEERAKEAAHPTRCP